MRADLESYLRSELRKGRVARDVIEEMLAAGKIVSAKQAWCTLEKWERRGEYECGVVLDLGWLTAAAEG